MDLKTDRFSLTAEKYSGNHHLQFYLEDCIAQLLEHKDENSKIAPAKFFSDYFHSVKDGYNTLFREYSYIHQTPMNRASFVFLFWKCYKEIGKKGDLLCIQEYHSLLTLLCPDFPFDVVQKTARIILLDDALDCLISFSDFIYAFQVQFFYEEFIEKCYSIYQSLMKSQKSPRDPVIVPTSETNRHQNNHHSGDGIDGPTFFRSIFKVCDRGNFSTPPSHCLKEILMPLTRVTFYEFLMALSKCETINDLIGRLPEKSKLFEGSAFDQYGSRKSKSRPSSAAKEPSRVNVIPSNESVGKRRHPTSVSSKRDLTGKGRSHKSKNVVDSSDDTESSESSVESDADT